MLHLLSGGPSYSAASGIASEVLHLGPRCDPPQIGKELAKAIEASRAELLTAAEAAQLVGRSRWWLWKHAEEIPAVILPGGRRAYSAPRLHRWLREREIR